MKDLGFAVIYGRDNKYSAHIVVAAVESRLRDVDVYLLRWDSEIAVVEDLRKLSERYRKFVVGFTFFTMQIPQILTLVKLIRSYVPRALLIAGGPHATADPLGTLTKLGFDIVVYGEGEDTVVELLEAVRDGKDERVCGTAYLEDGKVIVRKRSRYVDLDSYPPFPYWRRRFNPIEIMRGCISACYFCQVTYMFGRPRYRSIESISRYSEIMWRYGLRDLRFIAPNSFAYMSRDGIRPNYSAIEELLTQLRKLADRYGGRVFFGSFPSEVRPDSVDEDIIKLVKPLINNKRIIVGAQSGSNRILKYIHRGHSVEQVIEAVELLLKHGFTVDVDFIFGLPGETEEDVELTIKVMEKLSMLGARVHAHTFLPLPGTPFEDAPPGRIDPRIRKVVAKLIGIGRAYGEWEEQERLAQLIDELRRKRVIYTRSKSRPFLRISLC